MVQNCLPNMFSLSKQFCFFYQIDQLCNIKDKLWDFLMLDVDDDV